MGVVLSILIPTLYDRADDFIVFESELWKQAKEVCNNAQLRNTEHGNSNCLLHYSIISDEVECLINRDKGEKTTGCKRQELLEQATGEYVVFVDDDDEVFPYYIREMLEAAKSDADCIAINGFMSTNGSNEIGWELSKDFENRTVLRDGKPFYERKANHLCAIKRVLALKAGFPDISNGEDKSYSEAVNKFLKTEVKIDLPMYHYKYITRQKEYLK